MTRAGRWRRFSSLTAMSVAREKEQGTFDQLLVTPFRPAEIMVGKAGLQCNQFRALHDRHLEARLPRRRCFESPDIRSANAGCNGRANTLGRSLGTWPALGMKVMGHRAMGPALSNEEGDHEI
jgi:hypothetical protein